MAARPCLGCGTPTPKGSRCPTCQAQKERTRGSGWTRYPATHRQATAAAINTEPWCHNPNCPHEDAGTPTNPLTGDHPLPRSHFTTDHDWHAQPRVPLCKRCNASKGG